MVTFVAVDGRGSKGAIAVGGLLVGVGSVLGNGCTSGELAFSLCPRSKVNRSRGVWPGQTLSEIPRCCHDFHDYWSSHCDAQEQV